MKYRNLGSSGVKVSSLCLGAMTFGEADEKSFMHKAGSDEATAHAVLDRAVAAGINFVDTADVYGQDGLSERVLGNWLVARGSRDKVVLATKFRFTMGDGPNRSGASRHRSGSARRPLRRLRTDRIDSPDPACRTSRSPRTRPCGRSTTWCAPARCSTSAARTTRRTG
jgi:aryl-alcohol dehydrogenase-like predicted oxidoreductase